MFVEVVAADNGRASETRLVEDLSRLNAQESEVAGIQANAGELMTLLLKLLADFDRVADPFQRVVSVHEKDAVVWHRLGISRKGLQLRVERHHPTMCMSPRDGNAVRLSGQQVRGGRAATDVRRAAGGQPAVGALRAAETKLNDPLALRRQANSRRL